MDNPYQPSDLPPDQAPPLSVIPRRKTWPFWLAAAWPLCLFSILPLITFGPNAEPGSWFVFKSVTSSLSAISAYFLMGWVKGILRGFGILLAILTILMQIGLITFLP